MHRITILLVTLVLSLLLSQSAHANLCPPLNCEATTSTGGFCNIEMPTNQSYLYFWSSTEMVGIPYPCNPTIPWCSYSCPMSGCATHPGGGYPGFQPKVIVDVFTNTDPMQYVCTAETRVQNFPFNPN